MNAMSSTEDTDETRQVVTEHIAAFNEHSTARMLAGFTADAVWATGSDVFTGPGELGELFDDGLWQLAPSLTVVSLIADGERAAVELKEALTLDGRLQQFRIAVFFEVDGGLIRRAKVFREGSADLE